MLQDKIFAESEADCWFDRNRAALHGFDPNADLPLRLLELYAIRPRTVLEVGAANGARLAALHRRTGARAVALEPSAQAILDGQSHFPAVTFVRGTADSMPLRERYDLVIVNFVFHWIDRLTLLRSAAEVDRLVRDGGFLMIGDFSPSNRLRVHYHHLPDRDVHTYKQNYAEMFLAAGLYHAVALLTGKHSQRQLDAEAAEGERMSVWLLRKQAGEHYVSSARE